MITVLKRQFENKNNWSLNAYYHKYKSFNSFD